VASAVRRRRRRRRGREKWKEEVIDTTFKKGQEKTFFPRSGFEDSEAVTALASGGNKSEIGKSRRK
jgi:hypothetical protein